MSAGAVPGFEVVPGEPCTGHTLARPISVMTLEDFLDRGDADVTAVVAKVNTAATLRPDDMLLAVGSLAEGFGNSKSDLDLWLITRRPAQLLPPTDEIALVCGKCLVDLKIIKWSVFEALLARLETWSHSSWDVAHAATFSLEERIQLHRVLHGRQLKGDRHTGGGSTLRRPDPAHLARLKLHAARHLSRTIQVDMVGHRDAGDYRSLVFAAQELLGHAVDGLLAGFAFTNPLTKWRSRSLETLPADWHTTLVLRPEGMTAAQFVWRLYQLPECHDESCSREYACRVASFARAVFAWAELRIVAGSTERLRLSAAPPRQRRGSDATPLPHLDLDVDFAIDDRDVYLGRLNAFGDALNVSNREFALCLLCDGVTTPREAVSAVYGDTDTRAVSENTAGLIRRLVGADLLACGPCSSERR